MFLAGNQRFEGFDRDSKIDQIIAGYWEDYDVTSQGVISTATYVDQLTQFRKFVVEFRKAPAWARA